MNMIEVHSLVKQYDRAKEPSVKGIDFSVEKGEFFPFSARMARAKPRLFQF